MGYDYAKLRGRIVEKCGSQGQFAAQMGISEHTISMKINGNRDWRQNEIALCCSVLGIPVAEIADYFFTRKVKAD